MFYHLNVIVLKLIKLPFRKKIMGVICACASNEESDFECHCTEVQTCHRQLDPKSNPKTHVNQKRGMLLQGKLASAL